MKYDKFLLGKELLSQLESTKDIKKISQWAYRIFFEESRNYDSEIREILQYLFMMEEGPEFELTQEELKIFANKLVNNEKNIVTNMHTLIKKMRRLL